MPPGDSEAHNCPRCGHIFYVGTDVRCFTTIDTSGFLGLYSNVVNYDYSSIQACSKKEKKYRGLWVTLENWLKLVREHAAWASYPLVIKPIRAIQALRRRMQINQPCWSANRWKSLT